MFIQETNDRIWLRLERYLKAGKLIPVVGPSCITIGEDDAPLYPWLARQLVERLDIKLPTHMQSPLNLHSVACAHLAAHGAVEDLCMELDILLEDVELKPGPLLRGLARIGAFTHYFTLGFDPLLERALSEVRYSGLKKLRVWEFSVGQAPEDLPFGTRNAPHTLLAYLFGRVSPNPSFHLWDHDAIEFIWSLQRSLPSLNTLASTLATNNLLFLGTDFSDWLVRFFLRVIKYKPLNEDRGLSFLLAERRMGCDADAVLFYDALGGGIEMLHDCPLEFTREFTKRALLGFALAEQKTVRHSLLPVDREIPHGAIFISYCHTDHEFAFRVAEKLQRYGCLIWIDRDRIQGGDNFENNLEDSVCKYCSLFLSLITPMTESRVESYFHKERHWAAERLRSFAPDELFYIPLAHGDAPRPIRQEPRETAKLHIDLAINGEISDALCERLLIIQKQRLPVV